MPALLEAWKDGTETSSVRKVAGESVRKIDPVAADKAGVP